MRKVLMLMLVLGVLAAACGSEDEANLTTSTATPGPDATSTAAPEATAKPGSSSASGSGKKTGDDGGTQAQGGPAPAPAPEGGVNRPKAGNYVYDLDGKATDPTNPAAGQQSFPEDAEAYVDISHNGDVTTSERSSSEGAGVFTTRTRWEPTQILLLSVKIETQLGDFSCTFDPPLVIAHIPLKPETIPDQEFKGQGNACNGKLGIQVVRQETTTDATGKSWPAWQIKVHTEASSGQFSQTSDETQWFAPDLGVEVRSDGTSNGTVQVGPTGPPQSFSAETKTALKTYP